MKRVSRTLCMFVCSLLVCTGCGDDASDDEADNDNETAGSGGTAGAADPCASGSGGSEDEEVGPGTIEEATWHNVWRECGTREHGECGRFERCAFWTDDETSVCTSACDDTGDCVDPDHPAGRDFSAAVGCMELPESNLRGRQCVLVCTESDQCGERRVCSRGVCVWRDVGSSFDDAGSR